MATYKFRGRVLPSSIGVTLEGTSGAHWEDTSLSLILDATLSITKSAVEIVCESNLCGTAFNDSEVHLRAFDMARAVVDSLAYAKGLGLSVILETVIKPDGIMYNIQVERPDLAPLVTAFHSGPNSESIDLASMLPIVFSDPLVFMALNDLVASITLPHHAPVNCGRVIEAIRELMTPSGADRKTRMGGDAERFEYRSEVSGVYYRSIKGARHGDRKSITLPSFQETIRRAWIVMNRFLEFKKSVEGSFH